MDGNAMGGAIMSGSSVGVLDLEPMHHPQAHHQQQQQMLGHHHMQGGGLTPLSTAQHFNLSQENDPSLCLESKTCHSKASFGCGAKGKSGVTSDEDEPSFNEDCGEKGRKGSPWHRMKWTDSMVKLLINVVFIIGEDGTTTESCDGNKRKLGILQKKGKWKSVSRAMMERGCFVSPQQCEDKFNDLNKRYKRLNEILGRGTSCSVVENPSLLDTMDTISAKAKEDVRKILSSKHLFYKEMCAYHNGCKSLLSTDFDINPPNPSGTVGKGRDSNEIIRYMKDDNESDEEEEDEEEEEGDDFDDQEMENGMDADRVGNSLSPFGKRRKGERFEDGNYVDMGKSAIGEMMNSLQTGAKLSPEQQQWLRVYAVQLEEQKVSLQSQTLELERERFHWQKYSMKKDRELERRRLENEKMKLGNEQMALHLKQQELDIECKRSEASMASIGLILERLQSKESGGVDSKRPLGLTDRNCRSDP